MFVSDALGDHMVEAYSRTALVMALYVASMVSLSLPHLVEGRTLNMLIVLRALVAARSMCLLLLLLYALFNHPRLLIQVARVQKAQFSYRLDGLVP